MNILVIGNGFDLAHGLPTKYGDFLDFVQAYQTYVELSDNNESDYFKYFGELKDQRLEIYDEINAVVTNNGWLNYFISIYEKRKKEGKDGWIDFESEISYIIQTLDAARVTMAEQFKKGNSLAEMQNWQYKILTKIFNFTVVRFSKTDMFLYKKQLLDDLNRLTRCLEIYLCDYIQYEGIKPLKDIAELEIDKVLSFNYTNTYDILYARPSNKKVEYDYIHGKSDINKDVNSCNLVLGIDEYLLGDSKDRDNEYIQFKKFYQRVYKMTGCYYVDWLRHHKEINGRLSKTSGMELNIYIYGHSLDVTDADILRRLILEDGAITSIFYHSQEALGNQIANLVKIIGEEELIKRTDGRSRTIVFRQSSRETVKSQTELKV